MTLTEKHITYENDCRQMFVGQVIRAIIYGELKYFADEDGNNINPKPGYTTKYPDIDSLDHSIYFKTDNKTIYVYWDNTFICYGLNSMTLDLTEMTNSYEQKWDVSNESKWVDFIGQRITDFQIIWKETWTSNLNKTNKVFTTYPQTFEITVNNGKSIFLSASEFKSEDESEIYPLMDNLLVTTNLKLAKDLKII